MQDASEPHDTARLSMPAVPHACAVCARVLEPDMSGDWRHTVSDLPADHPAIAVPVSEIDVRGRCDLCGGEPVTSVIECEPIRVEGHGDGRSEELARFDACWGCCAVCTRLVRKGRWRDLTERAVRQLLSQAGLAWSEEHAAPIRQLHQQLERTMLSGPHRMPSL